MFDFFGRKRIKDLQEKLDIEVREKYSTILELRELRVNTHELKSENSKQGFDLEMAQVEIQGYKDRIARLEKQVSFMSVNKAAKRRNDVLLASIATRKSTVLPVLKYLNERGVKDPDGKPYSRSTVHDILKPPATK